MKPLTPESPAEATPESPAQSPAEATAESPAEATAESPARSSSWRSPLHELPGAVEGEGRDSGVAAHYGDLAGEQRRLVQGSAYVDLSHFGVVRVSGPDRLTWLHSLLSQHVLTLSPGQRTDALVLSPHGHVEHHLRLTDDGESTWAIVEPGTADGLVAYLDSMRFMLRVSVSEESAEWAVRWSPSEGFERVARESWRSAESVQGRGWAGMLAYEALRIERREARLGLDTDHRTIPHEVGWLETAVHLDKGCYRGQETVARVHILGRPPRRLVFLHLDGSEHSLPSHGAPVEAQGRVVGTVGSSARHYELGPIALAVIKRSVPVDAPLVVGRGIEGTDGVAAIAEVVVPPDAGLHVRPRL